MSAIGNMGGLMAEYEAELTAREQADRPAFEARRAAMIQREIDAGLRDADGNLIAPAHDMCPMCGEHHDPDADCGDEAGDDEPGDDEADA
jgi:hypothetical protein